MDNFFFSTQMTTLRLADFVVTSASKHEYPNPSPLMESLWSKINNNNKNNTQTYEITINSIYDTVSKKISCVNTWDDVINIFTFLKELTENNIHAEIIFKMINIMSDKSFTKKIISLGGWEKFSDIKMILIRGNPSRKISKYIIPISVVFGIGLSAIGYGIYNGYINKSIIKPLLSLNYNFRID